MFPRFRSADHIFRMKCIGQNDIKYVDVFIVSDLIKIFITIDIAII